MKLVSLQLHPDFMASPPCPRARKGKGEGKRKRRGERGARKRTREGPGQDRVLSARAKLCAHLATPPAPPSLGPHQMCVQSKTLGLMCHSSTAHPGGRKTTILQHPSPWIMKNLWFPRAPPGRRSRSPLMASYVQECLPISQPAVG